MALGGAALLGFSFVPAKAHHSAKPLVAGLVLFLGGTVLASVSFSNFPCPRCGKPFIHGEDTRDGFTRHCVHCMLPKWTQ